MVRLRIGVAGTFLLLLLAMDLSAKSWRGITPLKSTRADVERRFGKANELGRYEIENERAYIFYSEGPCAGDYRNLTPEKCECLVAKDTVLRIAVTLNRAVKFHEVDEHKFSRTPLASRANVWVYSDLDQGVVYTVDESSETLTAIDYWPSSSDCKDVARMHNPTGQRNVWRGIRPLHSTRGDTERILGEPTRQAMNESYVYDTSDERIDILYSDGPCTPSVIGKWNVPKDTVLRVVVYPQRTVLLRALGLDFTNYKRSPDPNIPDWFFWVNRDDGILIQSQLNYGAELVMSIEYSRTAEDKSLLCK